MEPGPVSVQVALVVFAVISVGPLMFCAPEGETVSGAVCLPHAQKPAARKTTAARGRLCMDSLREGATGYINPAARRHSEESP